VVPLILSAHFAGGTRREIACGDACGFALASVLYVLRDASLFPAGEGGAGSAKLCKVASRPCARAASYCVSVLAVAVWWLRPRLVVQLWRCARLCVYVWNRCVLASSLLGPRC
jgi:hypothetical protein